MLRVGALIVALSFAASAKSYDSARARAAVAAAMAEMEASGALTVRDEQEAKVIAERTLRPVFLRIGKLDCSAVCNSLGSSGIVCHAASGDQDRFAVYVYSPTERCFYYREWQKMPSETEAKQAAEQVREKAQGKRIDWKL